MAAAVETPDLAAAGRHAAEQASLIIAAWARVFEDIERRGGSIAYRAVS